MNPEFGVSYLLYWDTLTTSWEGKYNTSQTKCTSSKHWCLSFTLFWTRYSTLHYFQSEHIFLKDYQWATLNIQSQQDIEKEHGIQHAFLKQPLCFGLVLGTAIFLSRDSDWREHQITFHRQGFYIMCQTWLMPGRDGVLCVLVEVLFTTEHKHFLFIVPAAYKEHSSLALSYIASLLC